MNVAVYGASGHTARFVLRELVRRGHRPVAIARESSKLTTSVAACGVDMEMRIAGLGSAESLDRALEGVDAVVNCAGPFLDTARPVIEAALRAGVHYVDVTAEQGSAVSTFAHFDAPARRRGVCVLPAAGFYGGLGDLLATSAMSDWKRADDIDIAIALNRWWPTAGTRRTGQRNTAPRLTLREGRLAEMRPSGPVSWSFPEPFATQDVVELPFTETILAARHLRVRRLHNFLSEAPLRDIRDPETPGPVATDESGRSDQHFVVETVARNGMEERRIVAQGRDIYAITAPIVVEAVERICSGTQLRGGAFALGEYVDAADFLTALTNAGALTIAHSNGEARRAG